MALPAKRPERFRLVRPATLPLNAAVELSGEKLSKAQKMKPKDCPLRRKKEREL